MFVLGILFFAFIVGVLIAIASFGLYYESFLVIFVNISVAASYLYGTGLFKELLTAFKLADGKTVETSEGVEKAIKTIKTTMSAVWISGIIGFVIGVLPFILSDREVVNIAPYITFMVISVVYGVFGNLFLLPIKMKLDILKDLAEKR